MCIGEPVEALQIPGRHLGRRCDSLEDVSEDIRFGWEFLEDVDLIKEIKCKLISLIKSTSSRNFQSKRTSSDTSSRKSQRLPIRLPRVCTVSKGSLIHGIDLLL